MYTIQLDEIAADYTKESLEADLKDCKRIARQRDDKDLCNHIEVSLLRLNLKDLLTIDNARKSGWDLQANFLESVDKSIKNIRKKIARLKIRSSNWYKEKSKEERQTFWREEFLNFFNYIEHKIV